MNYMLKSKLKLFIYVFLSGLIIWASIILITNKSDYTPDAIYSESVIYQLPSLNNSGIILNFEYLSKGAFIAGKNRPINVNVTISPLGKLDLFKKIHNDGGIIIQFAGAKTYDDNNIIGNVPVPPAINNFYFNDNNNNLYNNTKLYYPTSGEYSPKILLISSNIQGQVVLDDMVILDNINLKVSPLETGLQLINDARIFALTLIIISLSIYSIIPINRNDKVYIEKILGNFKKSIKLKE